VPREWGEGNHLRGGNWSGNSDGKDQCHPGTGVSLILPISRPKRPADINDSSNMYECLVDATNHIQDTRSQSCILSNVGLVATLRDTILQSIERKWARWGHPTYAAGELFN